MKIISLLFALLLAVPAFAKVNAIKNETDFGKAFSAPGNKVLLFSATWCGPCQEFHPIYEKISDQMTDLTFYSIDIDEPALQAGLQKAQIPYIPMVSVIKVGVSATPGGVDIVVCGANPEELRTEDNQKAAILKCLTQGK